MPKSVAEIQEFINSQVDNHQVKKFIEAVDGNEFQNALQLQTFLQKCKDNIASNGGIVEDISGNLDKILGNIPQNFNSQHVEMCRNIISEMKRMIKPSAQTVEAASIATNYISQQAVK